MKNGNVTLEIVIKGPKGDLVAKEFLSPKERDTFIEGREGSNFVLRIRNGNPFRITAVVSVDGLSVIDGEKAGRDSRGYVVAAHGTVEIPGWTVDSDTVAKFLFAGMKDGQDASYVAQIGGDVDNKGGIGLIAFKEKRRESLERHMKGATFGASVLRGRSLSSDPVMLSASSSSHEPTSFNDEAEAQSLGTGFGKAQEFGTHNVRFERGEVVAEMDVFYDDARGLKRRGIDVDKPVAKRPSTFPADVRGCTPPPGWDRG
jgi:hypothetical protein